MTMRFSVLPMAALVLAVSSGARANNVTSCDDAFDQSQVKRDEGKLLEARRLFRACGAPTCSPTQEKLCAKWLADVEVRVPSVILGAKNATGSDLVDVTVMLDGFQVAKGLDGRAIDVDPGRHTFTFVAQDGARAETQVVVEERAKGKMVSVTFASPAAVAMPPSPPPTSSVDARSPLRTTGFVTVAVGVGGLALGAVFGILALSTKSSDCQSGVCTPGSSATAYRQGNVSTVGFIAGGALLAGGVTLVVVARPPSGGGAGASVMLTPLIGSSLTGLDVRAQW
jgi:hypothetical protein